MIRHIRALAASLVVAALSLSSVACVAPAENDATDVREAEETTDDLVSRSASFETFEGFDGRHYFHLLAGNGANVLRSQGYTSFASAMNGVSSVLENGSSPSRFSVLEAKNGDYYFNLEAANHEVIGTSQLYATKANAERAARTVRGLLGLGQNAIKPAPLRESFELFTGEDKKAYFRLRAGNGEILLGSQGYTAKSSAKTGIASVRANGTDASNFRVVEVRDGSWGVSLVAVNGETVARGESYTSKTDAIRAAGRMAEILAHDVTVSE